MGFGGEREDLGRAAPLLVDQVGEPGGVVLEVGGGSKEVEAVRRGKGRQDSLHLTCVLFCFF